MKKAHIAHAHRSLLEELRRRRPAISLPQAIAEKKKGGPHHA